LEGKYGIEKYTLISSAGLGCLTTSTLGFFSFTLVVFVALGFFGFSGFFFYETLTSVEKNKIEE